MDELTDDQLDALFKVGNAESLQTALRSIYQAGVNYGWANPQTVTLDVPAAPQE